MMAGKLQRVEAQMARMTKILNALYKDLTSRPADPPPNVKPAERENQQFFFSQPPPTTAYQPATYAPPGRQEPAPGLDRARSASQPPHPGNSPLQGNFCHTPEKAALVAAEYKAILAARGGSTSNLFRTWETANPQAIIMTTDLVTGSASGTTDDLSELKYMHAPEHGVMIDGKGMLDIDSLRDHTDSARQLMPHHVKELAESRARGRDTSARRTFEKKRRGRGQGRRQLGRRHDVDGAGPLPRVSTRSRPGRSASPAPGRR